MITLTRSLARQLRAVFRRAGIKTRGGVSPPMLLSAGGDGLRIQVIAPDAAIEHHVCDDRPEKAEITVPVSLLDDCQGKADDPVTIEQRSKKKVLATWRDKGIPQTVEYDVEPWRLSFPALPESLAIVEQSFWEALDDAAE